MYAMYKVGMAMPGQLALIDPYIIQHIGSRMCGHILDILLYGESVTPKLWTILYIRQREYPTIYQTPLSHFPKCGRQANITFSISRSICGGELRI